ncbi:SRPBCC family protein [Pseudanabaena yagii]|uniref:Coenzyme Q-binding protein COQ10 START domain-containing protein n=1 Tax=Pseudanabaena yagii GIHE-NHR1 TaxID=2722753 RepID=A0ABX1LXN2_9CYAN|nr:SRPBCC family protein [Pseudanabaena yagii]NMF60952.1 hypothetical protein [Pseudanabaena yagii GIHE-NHR1]
MSDWLEHTVQTEVTIPVEYAWSLWSDLSAMPRWMKWIDSVVITDDPEISAWKLGTNGLTFTWKSRILKQIPNQIMQWESIGGLPNRGAVRFYGRPNNVTIVKLSIAYAIPAIGQLMDNLFLGQLVESTLQEDLERFRVYAQADFAKQNQAAAS